MALEGKGRGGHQIAPRCCHQSAVLTIKMDVGLTEADVVSTLGDFRRYEDEILKC